MFYKNVSYSEKTFYGVKFLPGEVAEVPGYINDRQMIVVPKPAKKQTSASSEIAAVTPKKDDKKDSKKSGQDKESTSK